MEQFRIQQRIGNSEVEIIPYVLPHGFNKVEAFIVQVSCCPAFKGGDKHLMAEVCKILTNITNGETVIRTEYVVNEVHFERDFYVSFIRFQVLTPLYT